MSKPKRPQVRFSPSEDDLQRAAPHVQYESDTYLWAWKAFQETADSGPPSEIIRRRLIAEALLVHFRNLLNFFRPPRSVKPEDILACHFVAGGELDAATARLETHRERLNSLLSHLSYKRAGFIRDKKMDWPIDEMTTDLAEAWRTFLRLLPAERRRWFISEHSDEIPICVSPMVTMRNPMHSSYTTTVIETREVLFEFDGDSARDTLGPQRENSE